MSPLEEYKRKRRGGTPEPLEEVAAAAAAGGRFVVQEHSATRMHWDLRLERDGVLASWALPRGFPERPDAKDNRKAVHTEDHPLEYLEFHGEIPAGHYGAGTMTIWDRGTYECHKWDDRHVIVTLHGERVQGRYALFQAGKDEKDWLIHRMDPPADDDRDPFPEHVPPMLARAGDPPPAGDERWAFEVKWDGIRAICFSEPGRMRFESRNLNDVTASYPELSRLNRALGARTAVLDGEIVAFDEEGRPSFSALQQRMHVASEAAARRRAKDHPVTYVIFDLLYLEGRSLLDEPYEERRRLLDGLDLQGPHWQVPSYLRGDGQVLLDVARDRGLEGIVAKRVDCPYRPGQRTGAWIKVKVMRRQELVIGGWLPGEGRRQERLGALLVGVHDESGALRYAGRVGTGFDEAELRRLGGLLAERARPASPFAATDGPQPPRGARFVEPDLVAEVEFGEWTRDGVLRHPSYKGLRDDKAPEEVVREADGSTTREDGLGALLAERPPGNHHVTVDGRSLRLTNLDKVMYPQAGFTKADVIDYYRLVAPVLLPHLTGRPLTLKRYPNGVDGEFFYEKQCPRHRPDWVHTAVVQDICYCLVEDVATLVWTSNLADLELHTPMITARDPTRSTMVVFDLDPGEPAGLEECCQVALVLRGLFDNLGLRCFPKTSGSKGMQLYVPVNGDGVDAELGKGFAKAVAETLERGMPELVVSRMTKKIRGGKVLVDWSQNDDHKTTVCVYSLRARERPTVSTPLTWEEVAGDPAKLSFEAHDVVERVEQHGDLFAPVVSLVQELPVA